jgi:hypothetical protein
VLKRQHAQRKENEIMEPIVMLFAIVMAIVWTVFPFVIFSRLKKIEGFLQSIDNHLQIAEHMRNKEMRQETSN